MKSVRILISMILTLALCLSAVALVAPTEDRAGNAIELPETIESIVSLAPSITQVVIDLGLEDKLVAVDPYTVQYEPQLAGLPQFDMMTPDAEQLAAMEPDVIFVSGMSYVETDDPFQALIAMGIPVVVIPSSESIQGVKDDILFIGECLGVKDEAEAIVADMTAKIDEISAIGSAITEKKSVLFEVAALPSIYTFGSETYLNEIIELIGAKNIFADQQGWISVSEEDAVAGNPDVILTNVDYIDDPVAEILNRAGWQAVSAIANQQVYRIDSESSGLPNHHIVKAMVEMAKAIYPEAYEALTAE